ncbi:MAG: hypothetical protein V4674_00510 [Patescibacteria group bacterium]
MKKEAFCCKRCEAGETWMRKHGRSMKGINEWDEACSIVEERPGKCVISVPRHGDLRKKDDYSIDKGFGLIGIMMLHSIQCTGAYLSKKEPVICFEFLKKDANKIREIEEKYFSGKMQVDAKQMSMATMTIVNHLLAKGILTFSGEIFRTKKHRRTKDSTKRH